MEKLTEQVTEDSDLLWWQLTKDAKICRRMVRVVDTTASTLMKCMRRIYGKRWQLFYSGGWNRPIVGLLTPGASDAWQLKRTLR
jgi:hypothetical protein